MCKKLLTAQRTIICFILAVTMHVNGALATVLTGKAGTTATVNFTTITCSDATYTTYVGQGYASVYTAKTSTDNTYSGDKAWFKANYCGGQNPTNEKCFAVTASGASITSTQTKKYLIYAADCTGNDGSTRNAIYLSNSGGIVFGEDNKTPSSSSQFGTSIAYVSFLTSCSCPLAVNGSWTTHSTIYAKTREKSIAKKKQNNFSNIYVF